ncbi:PREDICTED: bumetanide-sensitive sodium-(potassium)-chloride cotransporter-like isoform X1 [Papilio xuthus]|uniref:Bumetanide-sensitive sodium-(Potassium)-chloride cotransporter-like isoform X1 n=2 Tax=Papilio xuthus TaxID=66420 RepID=A0AAJ7EB32_PAPXU|nr:PREDICTED: bumetanide-sensitive sodium-(potassium)-chloride cotransporter-like isoform X1 [Papilio xuthus]
MEVKLLSDCLSRTTKINENNMNMEDLKRSSLVEMETKEENDTERKGNPTPELTTYGGIKLGWIQGVLIPCLLNIWGVMLFLRISWIVAQAGVALTILIVLLSALVCVLTTLSLSAICTNGQVQGGGVYYLVSRSLGAEFGASVGIIFACANSVAASMNTIGFCESLNELLKSNGLKIIDNDVNDIRLVGTIALLMMCLICAVGMDWETKTQNFLITVIVVAIAAYVTGAFIGPTSGVQQAQGFVGINLETAAINIWPDFRHSDGVNHNFFTVFAMFFPAVTGVQAGANICGDLKDPATAIPKGTFLALAISFTSYLAMSVLCGTGALRDASGNLQDLVNNKLDSCKPNCLYGLHNNYSIMQLMSLSSSFIYAGCWAATLSTALTNLLSVPRLIQALGVDRIYPGLIFFAKPYGKHGEPYRGYVLTFLVSLLFLLIANLNTIAPLITNFYLASYALINFCTFHAAFIKPISWRPSFKYYNTWLSFVGFVLCIAIMVVVSWVTALATLFVFIALYLLVLYRNPEGVDWGSSTEAHRYMELVWALVQASRPTHSTQSGQSAQAAHSARSYRPQLLLLAGRPPARAQLLHLAHLITKVGSFVVVADITESPLSYTEKTSRKQIGESWLRSRKIRGFYTLLDGFSFESGVRALIQSAGLGKLAPNIMLIGYKSNWMKDQPDSLRSYVRVIQLAFEHHLALAVYRASSEALRRRANKIVLRAREAAASPLARPQADIMNADSNLDISNTEGEKDDKTQLTNYGMEDMTKSLILKESNVSQTQLKSPSAEISLNTYNFEQPLLSDNENDSLDAWWLYDDGGLNILLPYIIARHKTKIPLRIFALAKAGLQITDAENRMRDLLNKFRIDYSSLTMVQGINKIPTQPSIDFFASLVQPVMRNESNECFITEAELDVHRAKTYRQLRLRELLLENSIDASLVVITLPMPRKGAVSPALYMAWLEVLSRDLPPVLFVRGNDSSVLSA